jgi:hypothetical protein
MRIERQQSKPSLGTDDFDSSVVQAAWAYHTQIGVGGPKSNAPVETRESPMSPWEMNEYEKLQNYLRPPERR